MSDKFSKIPIATANRSLHDLSAPHITSSDFGRMDVVYHTQLVPGDDVNVNVHSFLRCAPMPAPTFGKVYLNVRAFFVPHRIHFQDKDYWNNWRNGLTSVSHPYVTERSLVNLAFKVGNTDPLLASIYRKDWRRHLSQLGFPQRMYNYDGGDFSVYDKPYSPFSLNSYQLIWWYWYRDSNLIYDNEKGNYIRPLTTGVQTVSPDYFRPRYCCYQKDIFTTAFVNPQSGEKSAGVTTTDPVSNTKLYVPINPENVYDNSGDISAMRSASIPIQYVRAANALQHYLERNNIAGGRVQARFLARFGIQPNNVRLDMPEYCGGFTAPLRIGDVTANIDTSAIGGGSPNNAFGFQNSNIQGQLGGKAYVDGGTGDIKYHASEDGTFMIISTLVPEIFYYQGVPADLVRGVNNIKEDYFTPEYEGLGYEPLKRAQVAATTLIADPEGVYDNEVFGFVPRYSNYKYKLGTVSGDNVLRETATGMQSYHLGRGLLTNGINQAALIPEFTMITPNDRYNFDRIFSIVGEEPGDFDHFEGIHLISNKASRPMTAAKLPSLEEDSHSAGKQVTIDNGGMRM